MDPSTLRDLPRGALQKLAKENHIKANLKSNTIIRLLLEPQTNEKPVSCTSSITPLKGADRASPCSSTLHIPAVNIDDVPSNSLRRSLDPLDPPPHADIGSQAEDVHCRSPSVETTDPFATPESSIAGTPEPEADPLLLQRTVEMIADIDRVDKQTLDKITKLRTVAAKVRVKASDLRNLLQAECAMRTRMEDYWVHWTQTNPRWTYEEVWSGQIRVRNMYEGIEVTTSDEEDLAMQEMYAFGELTNIAEQEPVGAIFTAHRAFERDEGVPIGDQLDVEIASGTVFPVETERPTDIIQNRKRQREETPNDEAQDELRRYSPRRRSEGRKEGRGDPTEQSVIEGKGKRSLQEVEAMMNQRQHQGDVEGSCSAGQHDLVAVSGPSQEGIEENVAVTEPDQHTQGSKFKAAPNSPTPSLPAHQVRVTRGAARTSKAPL